MKDFDKLLLSTNEKILFSRITNKGDRPRDLWRATKIPHASLYLAFKKLCTRGLTKRYVSNGEIYWKKTSTLNEETIGVTSNSLVSIHSDRDSVRNCVSQILELRAGARVIIVEGTQNHSGWFELFTKEETIAFNKMLSNKKIVCESILPDSYFQQAVPRLGKEWALSYKARPIITYVVKKSLISSDALLIVVPTKIIILYAKEVFAIEIQNKEILALIKGMINIIKENAKKVSLDENFLLT